MSGPGGAFYDGLFSSIVSDIKSYNGADPLLPWIRGIRKMKETLSPHLLKQKLPRFLERCSVTFLTDRRYSNDLRYLRVWLQLMDFVDDPKEILTTMEANRIGIRKSLFYQAYALYYEKLKKFDAADRIYHLGVQNFAEPADELQRSYGQFLQRKERHKIKSAQAEIRNSVTSNQESFRDYNENSSTADMGKGVLPSLSCENHMLSKRPNFDCVERKPSSTSSFPMKFVVCVSGEQVESKEVCNDDTVAVIGNFGNVGKPNAEDTLHLGLEEPTINTKEAMHTIGNIFQKPLELSVTSGAFDGEKAETSFELPKEMQLHDPSIRQVDDFHKPIEVFFHSAHANSDKEQVLEKVVHTQKSSKTVCYSQASLCEGSNHAPSNCSTYLNAKKVGQAVFREDTVVCRFVGSTISDEPEVENVWHHGLIDPTVNLKEAMEDINNMFGKSIEFTRKNRQKKQDTTCDAKGTYGEFVILPDDDSDNGKVEDGLNGMLQVQRYGEVECSHKKQDGMTSVDGQASFFILSRDELDKQEENSHAAERSDLFEQTVCTKEAFAEINKLFAMPLDF